MQQILRYLKIKLQLTSFFLNCENEELKTVYWLVWIETIGFEYFWQTNNCVDRKNLCHRAYNSKFNLFHRRQRFAW